MHRPFFVDRIPDSLRSPQPKVHLAECPMCRDTVPADQLTRFIGRTMCRNCAAMWFEEDEAENDGKADS